ncbi:uncharacterized protein CPUR_01534 [Claviceps purpurea 20.1]|uniref:Uncharacterized protein n=1 Tax=Claviceps purpurea (strain 20.1) TaxID=1111077 RepID=M1W303_CLAP2|nr:uncharacterized protein CPUR_01534 [Claviceps purpurea 20.1]
MSTVQENAQIPTPTGNDLIAAHDIPVNDQDDIDSIFSEDRSSTTSIASSVLAYRQSHGRTYHSDKFTANYFVPNDDQQLESEELCHHFMTILLDDQLFLAPLEKNKIHRVLASYGELYRTASKVLNRPLFVQEIQPQAFNEAGFVEKRVARYKIPIGPWAKDRKLAEVGRIFREALENDMQGYTQMLWQSVQKPEDEYHVWLATVRKAIRNPKLHSYMMVHSVYGRKPV